jgi:NAD(P)-dependent dehydrogenase (short-subunit alcohol dehydrogenase family)
VDREPDLARGISDQVANAVWWSGDVTSSPDVEALVQWSAKELGPCDGLVDIVGRAARLGIAELTEGTWDDEFEVNVRQAFLLGQAFGDVLARQGHGSLVFVGSVAARYGTHVTPAYHAAKAALLSLTRSLAVTYGPSGVRANTVSPGVVRTERMLAHWQGSRDLEAEFASATLAKRLADPSDIACAAAFLCTDAASHINGHDLVVDGGTVVRDPYYGDPVDETRL